MNLFKVLFWAVLPAFAGIQEQGQVLFLEVQNPKGGVVQLEPGFPYAHVMISLGGKWLHSHPQTGVKQLEESEISQFGIPKEAFPVLLPAEAEQKLRQWLHRPYDSSFHWGDARFYCSELVAKLLGLAPQPMHFDPALWPPSYQSLEGQPGISPGKIYEHLKTEGFSF